MSEEKRLRQTLVRLTDSEHKELRAEAKANGRELAQHIRWLAFQARGLLAEKSEQLLHPAVLVGMDVETLRGIIREELDQGSSTEKKTAPEPR